MEPFTTTSLYDRLDEITREAIAAKCKMPSPSLQHSLSQMFDIEGLRSHIDRLITLTHGLGRQLKEYPDLPISPPPDGQQAQPSKRTTAAQRRGGRSPSAPPPPSPVKRRTAAGLGITQRQVQMLDFIRDFTAKNRYGPTLREIGDGMGISSPNGVICHLNSLEKKGLINRGKGRSRSIIITDDDE